MTNPSYTTQLAAGLGVIEETLILLDLWAPGMSVTDLMYKALEKGSFPNITFRRLRNLVGECFKPRYLVGSGPPALVLKTLQSTLNNREFEQLLFIYTCRANLILSDFVREVYWIAYASGREILANEEAHRFIVRANQDGKTARPWSENTINNNAGYLTNCCSDYGLLEGGRKIERKILAYRLEPRVGVILAHLLHFAGISDNSLLESPDWGLFGMAREDVLDELKRQALKGYFIVQAAGSITRIAWQTQNLEELAHVLSER